MDKCRDIVDTIFASLSECDNISKEITILKTDINNINNNFDRIKNELLAVEKIINVKKANLKAERNALLMERNNLNDKLDSVLDVVSATKNNVSND